MTLIAYILSIISLVFLGTGMFFLVAKILFKLTKKEVEGSVYSKIRSPLYQLHKAGPVIATILGFIHGFLYPKPFDVPYMISGVILGLSMLGMSVLGIVMGFKSKWIPYTKEQDKQYLAMRIIKYVLTLIMVITLVLHYIL